MSRSTPKPRIRRLATLWIASLFIAALGQHPIAWACAWLGRNTTPGWSLTGLLRPSSIDSDTEFIQIGFISHRGVRAISVEAFPPTTLSRRYQEHHTPQPDSPEIRAACAPWSPEEVYPALADASFWPARTGVYSRPNLIHTQLLAFRVASGWPFPCVEGRIEYGSSSAFQYIGIITDPRCLPPPTSETAYLCYLPRWPALIANTLIDGTLLAFLWLAVFLTRRSIIGRSRRRRNLCTNCAYDLSHTPSHQPCPECGTPTPLSDRPSS